ncbi:MAG: TolC family protein [Breznakibacter sp.]
MKRICLFVLFMAYITVANAQPPAMEITLSDALMLGQTQSLQSLILKHNYWASYWQYRSYKANYLPLVKLSSTLASYNNSSRLRYNSLTQSDEYVRTQNLSSDAEIVATQRIGKTGGSIYTISDLGRIQNYGDKGFLQYASTPFRVGYSQDLFGYNPFKWEKKLEPMKLEKAKREYAKEIEEMNLQSVQHFYALAIAHMQYQMALLNYAHTDTLVVVAQKRFALGSITRDELIDLRLSLNNISISVREAELVLRDATEAFKLFFMLPAHTNVTLILPQSIPTLTVDAAKALEKALQNNPLPLQQQQYIVESARNVSKAKSAASFQASLSLSYGISKNDGYFDYTTQTDVNGKPQNVYEPAFDNYQTAKIGFSVPLLDWGSGKGNVQMAQSQQEVTQLAAKQALQQFEQKTISATFSFNIQKDKVDAALLSDSLATESYQLTVQRFRTGKADVLKLTSSQQAKDNARYKYISAMASFWYSYFSLRSLTLYDFEKGEELQIFDKLINEP